MDHHRKWTVITRSLGCINNHDCNINLPLSSIARPEDNHTGNDSLRMVIEGVPVYG